MSGPPMARSRPSEADRALDRLPKTPLNRETIGQALELTRTLAVEVEYWPTLDPSLTEGNREERLEAYRTVRDRLMEQIIARLKS